MVVIGTEDETLAILRQDRPDLPRENVLVLSSREDEQKLRGLQLHQCTAIRDMGDPRLAALVGAARARRVLPPLAPKGERKREGEQ